jgi:hypothetical protein
MHPSPQTANRRRPAPVRRPDRRAADSGSREAEACLDRDFAAPLDERISFLVNGLYLFDRHRILEWEPSDPGVAERLEAQGHRVSSAGPAMGRGSRPGGALPAGAFDRAMFLSRAIGHAGDEEDRGWLKAMRRALRPGGLLLFHALDRDRAWSLVRSLGGAAGTDGAGRDPGPAAETRAGFDPSTGKVTVKLRIMDVSGADAPPGRSEASITAYNLGSIRAMLAGAGLELERAYGDWSAGSLEEAGARTGRILVVASKPRVGAGRNGRGRARAAGRRT